MEGNSSDQKCVLKKTFCPMWLCGSSNLQEETQGGLNESNDTRK